MSNAKSEDKDCQGGVCEVTFKPLQAARRTFQNLKAMAGDLMGKVKETLSGDSHDAVDSKSADQAGEEEHLEKMQAGDFSQSRPEDDINHGHLSTHSAQILDSFVQHSWQPLPGAGSASNTAEHLKMVHVRPRPPEGQREAPRYSNPWRYDSPHK